MHAAPGSARPLTICMICPPCHPLPLLCVRAAAADFCVILNPMIFKPKPYFLPPLPQVRAAADFWNATVTVLPEGHHDLTLQPDCPVAAEALLGWLEETVVAGKGSATKVVDVRKGLTPLQKMIDGTATA